MEIKLSRVLLLFCISIGVCATTKHQKDSRYIFTCPRSLKIGSTNQLQLIRFGSLDEATLKVRLFVKENYDGNETLASENKYYLEEGKKVTFINYLVDRSIGENVYNGRIQINGTLGGVRIGGSDQVSFSTPERNIIIIQTDKPLYKPGEIVRWRILKVNSNLKPSHKKCDVGQVYVEDPNGIRLFQFDDVPLGNGLYESEFPLANEPVFGNWKITLKTKNDTASTTVNIKKYVLPKFDVKITFPPFVLATTSEIPIQVCANYTYAKPVQGELNLNVSLQQYYYQSKGPVLQESIKLDGCYTYTLNVSLLQNGNADYYSSIMVFANVVEDGTGVQRNDTQYLQRTTSPLNLNFNSNPDQRSYFKPGLPYSGELKVTNPDNTPAAKERIELSYTVYKQRVIADYLGTKQVKYSKNFTTNAKGVIKYEIPPQNEDTLSIQLEARSIKYASDPSNPNQILNQPQTSTSLTAFYSPSGSFIQLQSNEKTIQCGSTVDVKLLFTSKDDADYKFYYEVISQGKVAHSGTKKVSFTTDDDVSGKFEYNKRLIIGKETRIVPPPTKDSKSDSSSNSEEDCPAAIESRYVPPIGQTDISFEVSSKQSPSIRLLVYYSREDTEIVADSMVFKVEKCFKNQVDFEFSDEVKQPGQTTQVKIWASPNSLCGIKAIDKSVTLLDNSDQLTADKVFQLIQNMDTGIYYSSDPCNNNSPQPGLPKKSIVIRPPGGYSSSSYEDSYTSFQNAGLLVISDMIVITRPCTSNGGGFNPIRPIHGGPVRHRAMAFSKSVARAPVAAQADSGITAQSAVDVRKNFPETWLFDMEMVGPSGVFTKQETLPDTITEWIGSAVCVSPEDGLGISNTTSIRGFQLFFISYTLPTSAIRGEQFTIVVSIFSYVEDALPITVSLEDPEGYEIIGDSVNDEVCIQAGTSVSFPVKVKATTLGNINITVKAETVQDSSICGSVKVSDQLARDAITQSLEIEAEGFPVETVQGILFCPSDEENQKFEATYSLNLPDDVVNGSERAFVDTTGNILGKTIENLNNLVSLPTGCGEQNLVKFVPNYLVLDYLTAIGELTDSVKTRAINNLVTGYQRQLNYRHTDGSFSAFGGVDRQGSMFLTAFVARSFAQAKKYITIDDSIVSSANAWIAGKQDADGCFPNIGQIIDAGIQGGLEKDKSPTAITAYVLASLIISKSENQTVIDSAISCLKKNEPTTPYETFLVAYAEALAGNDQDAKQLLEEIKPFARSKGDVESYSNPNGTKALDVETNSYAVLANLELGNTPQDVLSLIRFLTQNLKATGGFYSTQDTCVGLAALSGFATQVYKDPIKIEVVITGGLEEKVTIDDDNKLLVQRERVSRVPSELNIVATGTGCGLIQASLRYNSESPPSKTKFYIKVVGVCEDSGSKKRRIAGTVSYQPPGEAAGFSLVQIKMPTGVVPDSDSIDQLSGYKNILLAEVETNKVNLYFNEINNIGEEFEFLVLEAIEVDNPHPGSATVVDYYAPEISATTTYSFDCSK